MTYANAQPLAWVAANPAQGQYALDGAGGYLTSAQDAGANLLLNYGYVPLISPIAPSNGRRIAIAIAKESP